MDTSRIILLVIQLGVIGFLLFYALPRTIKLRREFKKQKAEVKIEMEELRKVIDLCTPIFKGKATDVEIAAFQAYRIEWEKRHPGKFDGMPKA